jgi:prophage tail gpP-like protein
MRVKVNGNIFVYFNEVTISTTLDTVASTFSILARYDPDVPGHRELFTPLSYASIVFYNDDSDRPLSTGTIVRWIKKSGPEPNMWQISGYSKPGVIEDCQIPYNMYPLESNNKSLKQITERLLKPFGINLIVYDIVKKECDQIIEKTVARPEETIKDYICSVANQKNVIVSHDIYGNLIMFRPDVNGKPKMKLTDQNTLTMELDVDGTKIHSHITTIRQQSRGDNPDDAFGSININVKSFDDFLDRGNTFKVSSTDTVKNPLVKVFRPTVDKLTRLSFYDTNRAALNLRGAELKNVRIDFSMDYWPPISIGDIIEVQNPELNINNTVKMVLETTEIQESPTSKTMSGTLVLLETFTGDEPQNIFG